MGKSTFLQDFKAFAMKGNVIDMAVGVVIGGAFGKIVSSLVANVIMPPIGLLVGGVNFTDLKWVMKAAEIGADGKEIAPAVTLDYGQFLQATFDFLIIAFAIFLFIRLITKLTTKKQAEVGRSCHSVVKHFFLYPFKYVVNAPVIPEPVNRIQNFNDSHLDGMNRLEKGKKSRFKDFPQPEQEL